MYVIFVLTKHPILDHTSIEYTVWSTFEKSLKVFLPGTNRHFVNCDLEK